jgi:hypothetical protein
MNATTEQQILAAMLPAAEKRLRSWVRRANKWHGLCDALTRASVENGATPEQYEAALAAWRKGRQPSKASKYQAYSDARTIERARGLATRANCLPALCDLVGEPCNPRIAAEYTRVEDGSYLHRSWA